MAGRPPTATRSAVARNRGADLVDWHRWLGVVGMASVVMRDVDFSLVTETDSATGMTYVGPRSAAPSNRAKSMMRWLGNGPRQSEQRFMWTMALIILALIIMWALGAYL
jgi:hypothetical protein